MCALLCSLSASSPCGWQSFWTSPQTWWGIAVGLLEIEAVCPSVCRHVCIYASARIPRICCGTAECGVIELPRTLTRALYMYRGGLARRPSCILGGMQHTYCSCHTLYNQYTDDML
jgi:hypothetical protein